jgi:PKD repeat protein
MFRSFCILAILAWAIVPAGCGEEAPLATPPTANFVAETTLGHAPLGIQFFDNSTSEAGVTSWDWNFGDGYTSNEAEPYHVYNTVGSYTVTLTVTDANGSDTRTRPGYISVQTASVDAIFTATPISGAAPLVVQFTDQSMAAGGVTAWAWDFGDGATSTVASPSHTYTLDGTYTVSLTITAAGGNDTCTKANFVNVGSLVAEFTATPVSGAAPLGVQFTDLSTAGSAITSWSWNFGDGGTSTQQDPSHSYTTTGTYTVSLTVQTATGSDIETKAGYVTTTSTGVNPSNGSGGTIAAGTSALTTLGAEIYIPSSYAPSTFASPAIWLFNEALSDWKTIADNEKIIVVDLHEYNNTTNIVAKLNETMPLVENGYNVDKARYYWAGWSAGGNLAIIIGSQNQSILAGIMTFPGTGGNLAQPNLQTWTGHKIRMYYACGDQDPNYSWTAVQYEAGAWASWYSYTTKFEKVVGSVHYISESTYGIRAKAWTWIKGYNLQN